MPKRNLGSSRSASNNQPMKPRLYQTRFATLLQASTLPTAYLTLVPSYKSIVYPNLVLGIERWTDEYATGVREISAKRAGNRLMNYLDLEELGRAESRLQNTDSASLRFGVKKEGHGYHGERGDFCLTSGAINGKHLHLFYRSLELIGGLAYDLCLIEELGVQLAIKWKSVTVHAAKANVFALRGNSNEALYPKFRGVLGL